MIPHAQIPQERTWDVPTRRWSHLVDPLCWSRRRTPPREHEIHQQAKEVREARAEAQRARQADESDWERARKKYIGDRATLNPRPKYTGNLVKLAR